MCNNDTIKTIAKYWSISTLMEGKHLYYADHEREEVLSGNINIVLGNRGSGKTALCKYILDQGGQNYNFFAREITFSDYSLNILLNTNKNNAIVIWESFIYYNVLNLFASNEQISTKYKDELSEFLPDIDFSNSFDKSSFSHRFKMEIPFGGLSLDIAKKYNSNRESNLYSYIENAEKKILKMHDDSKYFILIDDTGISETQRSEIPPKAIGLLYAIFKVKQFAKINKINIVPIIFLNEEIYKDLSFSDKNKYNEFSYRLKWTPAQLKKMLIHRIQYNNNVLGDDFSVNMQSIFDSSLNFEEVFNIILELSRFRPRDFVSFIKYCCRIAISTNSDMINIDIMKKAELEYSRYLFREVLDDIYPRIISEKYLFHLLSGIESGNDNYSDFAKMIDMNKNLSEFEDYNPRILLDLLYDYNIIGNIEDDDLHPTLRFKYMDRYDCLSTNKKISIHPGLKRYITPYKSIISERLEKLIKRS